VEAPFGLGIERSSLAFPRRQGQRLTSVELHVEGSEKCCRSGMIAHEGDEID